MLREKPSSWRPEKRRGGLTKAFFGFILIMKMVIIIFKR